ncbi:coagulation factor XIII B chain-like [Hyla sarda]|uniref:coagulation factor XIII B chain-like n=1 Tax=Hyla sarda TaxID=327740 RepID=UPI0024C416CB|nr:coagulation factor XIII B chain-like [Hyla sarda]
MSPGWPCRLSLICLVLSGLREDIQAGGAESNMLPQEVDPSAIPEEKMDMLAETTARTQCKRPAGEGMIPAGEEFYDKYEDLYMTCDTGYRLSSSSSYMWIQCLNPGTDNEWSPLPQCIAQCKRPAGEGMIPAGEEFYDKDRFINVTCDPGYRPSSPRIQCIYPGTDNEWSPLPQCIAQCKQPADTDIYKIYGYKDSYNAGDYVVVECSPGYRTVDYYTTCVGPDQWSPPPGCIELCKRPSIRNLEKVYLEQEYYLLYVTVLIVCAPGYYPSHDRIQCRNNGSRDDWRPSAVCIEVKGTIVEVTSSRIGLSIVCTPDRCLNTSLSYISSCIHLGGDNIGCHDGTNVTFSDLSPNTQYEIQISLRSGRFSLHLQTLNITTPGSVPAAPDMVQTPSMEDGTIIWRMSEDRGKITGSELNIVARRDYNSSFSLNVTEWFPPNVTRYKISLHPGTNYTFRVRGFTSAGGGDYTNVTMETAHHLQK